IPLAWTSTKGWIRRLGKKWKQLHQLIYVAAALGVLHYLWVIKGDRPTAVYYGLVLVALLAIRALPRSRGAPQAGDRPPSLLRERALDPS
ncbi:MAG TPA: hypothetical protein VJ816_09740, partial [Gemmatimonadales bacterium]|nr:hypothetical protein [Gemmatimonadales bacterium]